MKLEKATIKTEACFSDNKQHRFYMKKVWDSKKSSALVLMLSAGSCNGLTMDYSSLFTVNNLVRLDYGSVEIMNLFTEINTPVKSAALKDTKMINSNNNMILEKAKSVDTIVFAWGRAGNTSKIVQERINQVVELLSEYKQKTCILCDEDSRKYFHPLAPKVRSIWNLQPIE
ncbi:conserved protein of unknown function [Acetoanaerobium sticklandii]|uniref:DUF1643 domain-containing protein n=1 Tax=Acetoanaerobium sticklandii (strain ATCC 12662 / DSM 519 / JCM 1433 / CCUG 9281 / NCIMB 10654 / HF) TaxID=499177 RepID=E3PVT9_ACESD|nr:DUF1643 domain-containing protein [Acetoanaerobium sticklandii]CBH22642.1 conserved protein of unknown function [Acetoanaerobium sticklandii]